MDMGITYFKHFELVSLPGAFQFRKLSEQPVTVFEESD